MDYCYDNCRLTVSEVENGKWRIKLLGKNNEEYRVVSALYCSQVEAQEALNTRAKNYGLEPWRGLPSKPTYSMGILGVMGKAERIA